jgi:beta-lactamase class A
MEMKTITQQLEQLGCQYAFYYRPENGEAVFRHNATRFSSASIIKVPILLAWLHLEQAGEVRRDEICDLDSEPQIGGAGFAHKMMARRLPFHDVLLMMIATSDNLCTNLVIQRLGLERLNHIFRQEFGLSETELQRKLMDFGARQRGLDNYVGAPDCVRLYELVAALPPARRAWFDSILLANTDDLLLKRNLKRDAVDFFHKTGSISGVLNDWGYTANQRMFLLMNDVKDERAAFELFGMAGEVLGT